MKVYYDADLDKRSFEGRTSIARNLKKLLEKKGIKFTNKLKEADLIHIHTSGVVASYKAYKLKNKYNVPIVYTLYSNSATEPLGHIRNSIQQRALLEPMVTNDVLSYSAVLPIKLRGKYLKKLDKVVVFSESLKKKMFKNTIVITAGIDVDKYKPKDRKYSKKVKVAYFGHPDVFKGMPDFVKASKDFGDNVETYLYMTKKTKKIENYVRKRNKKIKIFGVVDNINQVYQDIDIVILPYRGKLAAIANPLVLLEAMASGASIISTNLRFVEEIIGNAGVVVKPYDTKAIIEKVKWLADNPDVRKKLGIIARERIKKYYNQEIMAEKYLKLYKELK